MNKRDQKSLLYLIDCYAETLHTLRKVVDEITGLDLNKIEAIPKDLLSQRDYCDEKLDIIKTDIHKLLNPKANYFSYVNLLTYIGVFNCVLLAVRSSVTNDVLMAGLAALFPFLIYLVRLKE